jgi:hypothetical protein
MVRIPIPPDSRNLPSLCADLIVANRFLLKYTTRDAVDVLTTGTGGAHEARAAVAQYEDKSPLYGLLLYRRRKVLVKYIPEGTSRLLQGTPTPTPTPSPAWQIGSPGLR